MEMWRTACGLVCFCGVWLLIFWPLFLLLPGEPAMGHTRIWRQKHLHMPLLLYVDHA